jgi:hypothetical protein
MIRSVKRRIDGVVYYETEVLVAGKIWYRVPWKEAPAETIRKNKKAEALASLWEARPEWGYPLWTGSDGPVWVQDYAEGGKWTPIPIPEGWTL